MAYTNNKDALHVADFMQDVVLTMGRKYLPSLFVHHDSYKAQIDSTNTCEQSPDMGPST